MATWTLRPTALDLHLNPEEALKRHIGSPEEHALPPDDYYLNQVDPLADPEQFQDDPFGVTRGYPVKRNIIEDSNKVIVERNIYAHLNSSFRLPRTENDAYGDEHIDLEALTTNPPSFIFIGKPGIGKSTLAIPLAKKLNSVLISPQTINDYYMANGLLNGIAVTFQKDGGLSGRIILGLVLCRLFELDVIHRGYVMDGFPMLHVKDMSTEEQMQFIYSLPRRPDFVILLHMQDIDLYNRRRLQKYDPLMKIVYTMPQYMAAELQSPTAALEDFSRLKNRDDEEDEDAKSKSSSGTRSLIDIDVEDKMDGSKSESKIEVELEFKPLDPIILGRLKSRDEDRPKHIKRDIEQYKKGLPSYQAFVDTYDSRRVLELSAYSLPSELYKKVNEFLTNFGVTPVPLPVKIITDLDPRRFDYLLGEDDLDEFGEEAPCIPYPEKEDTDPDWDVVERTCKIRGRVDPRFHWRLSSWKNYCPVALKYGRTIVGKPELAVGFMDKLYFLSSEEAFKQFELNPRPFLLPPMPTSPVKFYVIGHPLAGKTLLSTEMATYLGAQVRHPLKRDHKAYNVNAKYVTDVYKVIDMKREIRRKFDVVKHDHLFRVRLKAVFDITREVDKQKFMEWKKLERSRREELLAYIDIMSRVDVVEVKQRRLTIINAREAAMTHGLGDTYSGVCQADDGLLGFSYKEFKENWRKKRIWPHQKKLELAWKLFNEGKLRYKRDKKLQRLVQKHKLFYVDKGEEGEGGEDQGESIEPVEDSGEADELALLRKPKRRSHRRRFCKPKKDTQPLEDEEIESVVSSVFGPDDEPDESIALRYPELEIPSELINAHPRPSNVTEQDPLVAKLVEDRLIEAEKYVEGLPPEIYLNILIRAIAEAELKYLEGNNRGPLSGGWIVENLNPDLEQFKAILRHPITAPDKVIVLADNSDEKLQLLHNLKREHYRTRQAKERDLPKPTRICRILPIYGQGDAGERNFPEWSQEHQGEAGEGTQFYDYYLKRTREIIGEIEICEDAELQVEEIPPKSPEKTASELIQGYLPIDTLVEQLELEISNSLNSQQLRDKLRQVSLADSMLDVTQRQILEAWLATFGIPEEVPMSPGPAPSSAIENPKCRPKQCQIPFPIANYNEKGWIPKKLNYELLSFPPKKFLTQRERIFATRGSSLSAQSDGDMAHDIHEQPFLYDENFEFGGEFPDALERFDSTMSLIGEEISLDSDGKTVKLPSLKGKFLNQIRHFDEFWNMLIPILNKEFVEFVELGVIDNDTVLEKVKSFWNSLEGRFIPKAKALSPGELKMELDEWTEANRIWNFAPDLQIKQADITRGEDEDSEESEIEGEEVDELSKNINKPEEYRRILIGIERMRHFGDTKNVCPVTLKNLGLIRKGFPQFAAKYLDRTYFLANSAAREEFLNNPAKFLPHERPLVPPCPRICVTGSPGCGQEEISLQISKTYNIYYVNFRQRLHEILKVQIGRNAGPGMPRCVKHARDFLPENSELEILEPEIPEGEIEGEDTSAELGFPGEDGDQKLLKKYDDLSLKNLGIMDPLYLAHCEQTGEKTMIGLANRDWKEMSTIEKGIQNFLQYGHQLPDEILEFLLPMLWEMEPFKSKGFILVGFPNTEADIQFLNKRNYIPEKVFVLESKAKTMHNRLLRKTVDEWFFQHPGEKQKIKDNLRGKTKKVFIPFQNRKLTAEEKNQLMNETLPLENSDDESLKSKDRLYKDTSVAEMISRNLFHWHRIYSKDLKSLKMAMNSHRIEWIPIHTDVNPIEAKRNFRQLLSNCFTHRQSMFESTYELSPEEAEVLLDQGYFHHSKFGRMCPVEAHKGNRAVNLWHAPGIKKHAILYRGFVYFLAGADNLNAFRLDPWSYMQSPPQTPCTPLYVIVLGHAKSGKTELCKRLEDNLGLVYISPEGMTNEIVQNAFLSNTIKDLESVTAAAEGSSMLLADEVLAYLRGGVPIPQYINYRILDYALMEPRSQFHGAVFDNYPLEDIQLQELLERGIVPAVVVNLQIEPSEGYRRAELTRFDPNYNYHDPLPDSDGFMDYMEEDYEPLVKHCLTWYKEEIQCLLNVDASQSPVAIFNLVKDTCYSTMTKIQRYIYSGLKGLPCRIDGLSPLTSLIRGLLSQDFGSYDPVALNDHEELLQVKDMTDLRKVVEYRGELFVFSSNENVEAFLKHPEAYTLPNCKKVPPKDVPISYVLSEAQMLLLKESWGFMDFDPVVFTQGKFNSKWLQRGDPKYCVEYRSRFYFFTSQETMDRFLKKPQLYSAIQLPAKLPGKFDPKPLECDALSPAGYLIASGLTNEVARMLDTVAKARPKFPFMSATKSSLLYLGYYLKTLNMKSSLDVRTHYRRAMMHMVRTQGNARDIIQEVNGLHGKQFIPEDTKRRLDLFLGLADLPDNQKVVDPFIPGLNLNYETLQLDEQKLIEEPQEIGEDVNLENYIPPPYLNKTRLI